MSKDDQKNVQDYLAHCARFNVSECATAAFLNLQQEQQNKELKSIAPLSKRGAMLLFLKEEHCVVILYPEEEFAGHVTPKDGNGATQRKPYGRIICFFHHLEKTFEVIFLLYTGGSTALGSYSRDIGKSIAGDVHTKPIEVFTILPNPSLLKVISEETIQSLYKDQRIFLGLMKIIITGEVDKRWVDMKIEPVVTSGFTTTQARVSRVWLSTANPSFELIRLKHYLVYVWAEVFLTA